MDHNPYDVGDFFEEDLRKSAKESLKSFFRDKAVLVPRSEIVSDYAVDMLMYTDYEEGFRYAHKHLLPQVPRDPHYREPSMKWEVAFLLKLLAEMRRLEIPKIHHPGLTLLYFRFCKGWEVHYAI